MRSLPFSASYLRGVNDMTFYYFRGFGQWAGNEAQESFNYWKAHGVDLVRLPLDWERLQPQLGGSLATAEVNRISEEINRANIAGIQVVLDLHNSGRHGQARFTAGITVAQFQDVWQRLSSTFGWYPGVIAYDLMNEPYDLDGSNTSDTRADAVIWEQYSQAAVDTIRAQGDRKLIVVEGVDSGAVRTFATLHPQAWINDPLNKTVYSAHQYFDANGQYTLQPDSNDPPNYRYSYWKSQYEANNPTPFEQGRLNELYGWVNWLEANNVEGYIGEVGWPSREIMIRSGSINATDAATESAGWNSLASRWFQIADAAGLSVTYFSASGVTQDHYYISQIPDLPERNEVFVHGDGNGTVKNTDGSYPLDSFGHRIALPTDTAYSQYDVLKLHPSR